MSRILITSDQIAEKVSKLAAQIAKDYQGKPLVLVGVLSGAFMFLADLSRALWQAGKQDIAIDFIRTVSYIDNCETSRCPPKVTVDLYQNISGKHVLIVEDIADTGHTLRLVQNHLLALEPASLRTLALLNKPSKREIDVKLDYYGFKVDGWIEGYGLDSLRASPNVLVLG